MIERGGRRSFGEEEPSELFLAPRKAQRALMLQHCKHEEKEEEEEEEQGRGRRRERKRRRKNKRRWRRRFGKEMGCQAFLDAKRSLELFFPNTTLRRDDEEE